MRTSLAAVTALTGSLLLPFLMLGSAQAVTSAPDLKNVMSTTHIGTVILSGGWRWRGRGRFVAAAVGIWAAWAVATWVAWVVVWVVLPVVASMVVPWLPAVGLITVTSITGTSSMTVTLITVASITVASSTIASLSPVVPGGGAITTIPVGGGQVGDGSGRVTERKEAGVRTAL